MGRWPGVENQRPRESFTKEILLPNGQTAVVAYTIAEKPLPGGKAGIILRGGSKSIGRPRLFGFEHHPAIAYRLSADLIRRVIRGAVSPRRAHSQTRITRQPRVRNVRVTV